MSGPEQTPGDEMAVADFRPGEIVLEIPARTEYVSFVRVVVAAAAEIEPDMDVDRIDDLRVAVSEATTNAIEAHGLRGVDDRIRIQCNLADDEVAVVVHDQGMGFEPEEVPALPEPDTPERLLHEDGLGVHLMELLADEAEISSTDSGTDVRLVVYSSRRRREQSDG
ncbi:MAG: ATP-binding protein [Acidimicrobiales bacterium]|nr:ATP-binding protein [Acidimicrobiales bacterium]